MADDSAGEREIVSSQYYEDFFLFKVEAEEANLGAQRQE